MLDFVQHNCGHWVSCLSSDFKTNKDCKLSEKWEEETSWTAAAKQLDDRVSSKDYIVDMKFPVALFAPKLMFVFERIHMILLVCFSFKEYNLLFHSNILNTNNFTFSIYFSMKFSNNFPPKRNRETNLYVITGAPIFILYFGQWKSHNEN